MKLLVVEDNKDLAKSICDYLQAERYVCEVAYSYNEAIEKLTLFTYDCLLLDIMLPDGNGLQLLNTIKEQGIKSGVIILTAKDSLDDKITGLERGGDDYMTKPFHLPELHARIRAIYRRKQLDGEKKISFNEITLQPETFVATVNDQVLDITPKEFDLLMYFVVNKNRVLSRQSIATHLWGDHTDNLSNFDFVYQHVKNLRKKINGANGVDYIETVYGLGYKFNANRA